MIRAAIIEDNIDDAKHLISLIDNWSIKNGKVDCEVYESAEEFLYAMANVNSYNVIFIDIRLNGISGIDLSFKLRRHLQYKNAIVITTGYKTYPYAKASIDFRALKYLEKPLQYNDIAAILQYEKHIIDKKKFIYTYNRVTMLLEYSEIIYFTSYDVPRSRIMIRTKGKDYPLNSSIKALCGIVPDGFVKCSSSYLVNGIYVIQYDGQEVWLKNGATIPISIRCRPNAHSKLERIMMQNKLI